MDSTIGCVGATSSLGPGTLTYLNIYPSTVICIPVPLSVSCIVFVLCLYVRPQPLQGSGGISVLEQSGSGVRFQRILISYIFTTTLRSVAEAEGDALCYAAANSCGGSRLESAGSPAHNGTSALSQEEPWRACGGRNPCSSNNDDSTNGADRRHAHIPSPGASVGSA